MNDESTKKDGLSILTRLEIEDLEKKVQFFKTRWNTSLAFHEYGDPNGRPILVIRLCFFKRQV